MTQTVAEALVTDRTRLSRVSFLAPDMTTLHELATGTDEETLDWSVTLERTRELRRQASVTLLDEPAGTYRPFDSSSLVWPFRVVRIERGLMVDGAPYYVPLITGLLVDPDETLRGKRIDFTVYSRLRLLDSEFADAGSFAEETRLSVVVRAVCEMFSMGADDALYSLDDGGVVLSALAAWQVGDNALRWLMELVADYALDLYDDPLGITVLVPIPDPSTLTAVWSLIPGPESLLLDSARSVRMRGPVHNRVIVIGLGPDHYPIRAEARDLNPLSPTYNPPDGSGPIGDRPAPPYVSENIHTQVQANDVARARLYEAALYDEEVSGSALWVPVEDRDLVHLRAGSVEDDYLLDRVQVGRVGPMFVAARKTRSLLAQVVPESGEVVPA